MKTMLKRGAGDTDADFQPAVSLWDRYIREQRI